MKKHKAHTIHPKAMRIGGSSKNNSQTTGKSKDIRPTPLQKYMCKSNRSYKHPRYNEVMNSIGQRKTKT